MSAWDLFLDLGWIGLLILIAVVLRATVRPIQSLFLPASLIAGLMGLVLGPNVLGIIPFSSALPTYAAILIAVVFAALPFTSQVANLGSIMRSVRTMWSVSQAAVLLQWGIGLLFTLGLLAFIFRGLPDGFGLMLAAGFMGGHGTAAALADGFGDSWEQASSLGMTAATVGILASVVGGIAIIKVESIRGNTAYLRSFKDLPRDLRTGMIPAERRETIGSSPVSTMSIDPLTYHAAVLVGIASLAYLITSWAKEQVSWLSIPTFCVAFLLGYLLLFALRATKTDRAFDARIFERGSGMATDLLVAFGIASIDPAIVAEYWQPLAALLAFGLCFLVFYYVMISKRLFADHKVEQGIFTWGWNTGTVAMGMALLRIVDPEMRSKTLDYYGLAYIPIGFVDIAIIAVLPALIMAGMAWPLALAFTTLGVLILALAMRRRAPDASTAALKAITVH